MGIFNKNYGLILTEDTDDGRINGGMTAVSTPLKRKVVFYSKRFRSGRESDSRVTFSLPFTVHVEAGNGSINGNPISWGSQDITMPANSFRMIYVDNLGVHQISNYPMNIIQNSIVLAYVNTGDTAIVNLEEVEKTGRYIYCRKQTSGNEWDSNELLICTGDQPRAFIHNDLIYLSYMKDDRTLVRIFDLEDEETFSYIPNIFITDNQTIIHLKKDPESTAYTSFSSANESENELTNVDLFPLGQSAMMFQKIFGDETTWIFLPFITGDFLDKIIYPYYLDIYIFDGESYILQETVTVDDNINYLLDKRWRLIFPPNDYRDRYFRVRVNSTLINTQYETSEDNQIKVDVFEPYNENGDVVNSRVSANFSSANISENEKVIEYEESRDFENDDAQCQFSAANMSETEKSSEYSETRDFESDESFCMFAAGNASETIIS